MYIHYTPRGGGLPNTFAHPMWPVLKPLAVLRDALVRHHTDRSLPPSLSARPPAKRDGIAAPFPGTRPGLVGVPGPLRPLCPHPPQASNTATGPFSQLHVPPAGTSCGAGRARSGRAGHWPGASDARIPRAPANAGGKAARTPSSTFRGTRAIRTLTGTRTRTAQPRGTPPRVWAQGPSRAPRRVDRRYAWARTPPHFQGRNKFFGLT